MRPRHLTAAILLVGAGFVALGPSQGGARGSDAAAGGTFRVVMPDSFIDYIDPALSYGHPFVDLSCARLLNFPDKPPPEGYRIAPEVANALPRVSNGGRTYTFTLRTNFRFSDGTPVRPTAFAHAIDRALIAGRDQAGAAQYVSDIVGAKAVIAGKAEHASGVKATGNRLVVTLEAVAPNFLARLTLTTYCAVPPSLPPDPEGVPAFPGSGPYTISEYVPGKRMVVERNPNYGGTRPHRVDRFVVDIVDDMQLVLDRIERGEADWGAAPSPFYFDPARDLTRKYGRGTSRRFFIKPGLVSRGYVLNMSRPLFRNNLALRRAINYAVDRPKLSEDIPSQPTDQYLPPGSPGYKDAKLYPLNGPDLRTARALARGHLRGGKAVIWILDVPPIRAEAQVLKQNLRRIGLALDVKPIPPSSFYARLARPGAEFDLAQVAWIGAFPDPSDYINTLFDSSFIGTNNLGNFRSAKYDRLMRRTAALSGAARYRAYGNLDVQLARDAMPRVSIGFQYEPTFVSERVGCVVLKPALDLAAVCLK